MAESFLVISDLQIPFEVERALDFCLYLKRHFKVKDENVLCVGDEVDNYWANSYGLDPDADMTPRMEIERTQEKLMLWYAAFPKMKLAVSNHGLRAPRKYAACGIPSIMLRKYRDVISAPAGWVWQEEWIVRTKHPFKVRHGDQYTGGNPVQQALNLAGDCSVAFGHWHSKFESKTVRTLDKNIWGAVVGCLIDQDAFATKYAKRRKEVPQLGALVVVNDGAYPMLIPYR